jgi:hypothetical protein
MLLQVLLQDQQKLLGVQGAMPVAAQLRNHYFLIGDHSFAFANMALGDVEFRFHGGS